MEDRYFVRFTLLTVLLTGLTACASDPMVDPAEQHLAETAILEARQTGGEQFAGRLLREAEERLALAERFADDGRGDQALRMLQEARVLAMRAEAESLAAQAVNAADTVEESLAAMEAALEADAPTAASDATRGPTP